ncbi:MAG: AMP-binding protein, partial [Parahaliea sp.]
MYQELRAVWQEMTAPGQDFEVETVPIGGVPIRSYRAAPPSLREVWLGSAVFADSDYLVFQEERMTYNQAHAVVNSIAAWLDAQGVGPGDRVAIAMR